MKLAIIFSMFAGAAFADAPEIVGAVASGAQIDVTLLHPDTGWDHYADGWAVEDAQGRQLGLRVLAHPHETEQPFTRGMTVSGDLPDVVYIRSRCSVDGWSKQVFSVTIQ